MTDTALDRAKYEQRNLAKKIQKLAVFLKCDNYKTLSKTQQRLLKKQYKAMIKYNNCLVLRIDNWR